MHLTPQLFGHGNGHRPTLTSLSPQRSCLRRDRHWRGSEVLGLLGIGSSITGVQKHFGGKVRSKYVSFTFRHADSSTACGTGVDKLHLQTTEGYTHPTVFCIPTPRGRTEVSGKRVLRPFHQHAPQQRTRKKLIRCACFAR